MGTICYCRRLNFGHKIRKTCEETQMEGVIVTADWYCQCGQRMKFEEQKTHQKKGECDWYNAIKEATKEYLKETD